VKFKEKVKSSLWLIKSLTV